MNSGFTSSRTARSHRRWIHHLRWLVLPGVIGLFTLVGLAISTEDRRTFAGDEAADAEPLEPDSTNPAGGDPAGGDDTTGNSASGIDASGNDENNERDSNENGGGSGDGSTVEITNDAGRVDVEVGEASNPIARPSTAGAEPADPVELGDGAAQGAPGLRLTDDGRLEPVDGDEIAPGDLVIEQAANGFDVVGADGDRVEIRPAEDGAGGFDVTELSADGERSDLSPDQAGSLDLGDGILLRVPIAGTLDQAGSDGGEGAGSDGADEQLSWWEQLTETPWRWVVLAFLALAAIASIIASYLRDEIEDEEPFGPDFVGPDGVPIDRFDEFLAMLRNDTDPARALRLAFHAAERGMGELPPRHSTETPFEWCDRAIIGRPHLGQPLRSLCDRFAATRFAPEQPSSATRDAALAELLDLHRLANGHQPIDRPVGAA